MAGAIDVIVAQYRAGLDMLRQTIAACPDSLWYDARGPNRYWHVAYHALFYTHLYLQPSLEEFTPWNAHRPGYQYLGAVPGSQGKLMPEIGEPYTQAELLEYLDICMDEAARCVPGLDLDGASGFSWLPFSKLELQIYAIRHLQHHAGELSGRLMNEAAIEVRWVGSLPKPAE